ncbi:MAG: hypothetical protein M3P14_09570 [Chloroflexota bacterium]|nr:hypothetical protein [Chloroflexota bacterium]
MNQLTDREFIAAVQAWLVEDGPQVAPDRMVDEVLLRLPSEPAASRSKLLRMAFVGIAASLVTLAIIAAATLFASRPVGPPSTPAPTRPATSSASAILTCPPATPACGDVLGQGITYTTSQFTPRVSFSVPTGSWTATKDEAWDLVLNTTADWRQVIALYASPVATDAKGNRIAGADTSPGALIAAWRRNPEIIVGPALTAALLGESATYVDIQPSPSATTAAGRCRSDLPTEICMPIFEAGSGPASADMYVASAGRFRIYLLEHAGELMAVTVEARHEADPQGMQALAAPILRSIRFIP